MQLIKNKMGARKYCRKTLTNSFFLVKMHEFDQIIWIPYKFGKIT
jgi:hypothetical protein